MRHDGQDDVEGVGQSLEEEEEGVDPGAAWAVDADPALLDRVALVAGPGQGRGPAVHLRMAEARLSSPQVWPSKALPVTTECLSLLLQQ